MPLYTLLLSFCNQLVPTWRKSQRVNLALLAQAIHRRRSLVLTDLARAYPLPNRRKVPQPKHGLLHRLKRVWRFLANPRPDPSALMLRLTRLSCSVCRTPGLLLPVLVDLTYFEPFAVLSANVPRGGRALPVAWRAFRRDLRGEPELSQNHIIEGLLAQMLARIAPTIQTVIVADREFASSRHKGPVSLFAWMPRPGSYTHATAAPWATWGCTRVAPGYGWKGHCTPRRSKSRSISWAYGRWARRSPGLLPAT